MDQVRTALSGSVRFGWKNAHWVVRPQQMAGLLRLPADGRSELGVGGPEANRYFNGLARAVNRRPKEASFKVAADEVHVRVVPSGAGRKLDAAATAKALLAGALSTQRREASLVVVESPPALTTAKAKAMGVTRVLASFYTPYSGTFDRITNLQLATRLINGTTLAGGQTFSFNDVVGPRTEKRGFRVAPTIMDNEYQDAFGGGVSQVATTVFNAAWEAGLDLTVRRAHSLYISRYPLGRDATVNYPDVNLEFINDTKHWVVMRGENGDTGITIRILGAPTNRHVESVAGPLKSTGKPKVERVPDPTMHVGEKVVEDAGEPSRQVTVTRTVYQGDKVLYEETFTTYYALGAAHRPRRDDPGRAASADAARESSGAAASAARNRRDDHRADDDEPPAALARAFPRRGSRRRASRASARARATLRPPWRGSSSRRPPTSPSRSIAYSKRKRARSFSGSDTRTQIRSRSSKRHGAR